MSEINIEEIERKFFFSVTESELYDATIQLTVPFYDVIHSILIDILNYHFGIAIEEKSPSSVRGVFLDVGAGTGKESLSILKAFPKLKVLAVDIAAPMEKEFSDNYSKIFDRNEERFSFVANDFLDMNFDENVNFNLGKFKDEKRIGAFSAYCIHHFDINKKKEAYQKMYDFLEPGGILINIDLFNYESKALSRYAHHFDIEYIKNQFDRPNEEFTESAKLTPELRKDLKEKWINHMNKDNRLDSVEAQIKILKEIGFKNVECPFRYFQQGVIISTK